MQMISKNKLSKLLKEQLKRRLKMIDVSKEVTIDEIDDMINSRASVSADRVTPCKQRSYGLNA